MARTHRRERPVEAAAPAAEETAAVETPYADAVGGAIPEVAPARARGAHRTASEAAYDKPELEATETAMGGAMVSRMNEANGLDGGQYDLDHGIHYDYNYEYECQRSGKPERWKDEYRMGHNASGHFVNPHESGNWMEFALKPGHSASKAIQAWLGGLTVAECLTTVIAMQFDTLRRAIGDHKFDQKFGSENKAEDKAIPEERRLKVAQGGTPIGEFTKSTELAEAAGARDPEVGKTNDKELDKLLKPGEWYYFYNHPKYLLKHPGGAWQGENSLYMGKNEAGERLWSGLGASNKTEDDMLAEMVSAYNAPRDETDERDMRDRKIRRADGSFFVKKYDPAQGEYKEEVTREEIQNDAPYTIGGVTRKGGFLPIAGVTFDTAKVKKERDR